MGVPSNEPNAMFEEEPLDPNEGKTPKTITTASNANMTYVTTFETVSSGLFFSLTACFSSFALNLTTLASSFPGVFESLEGMYDLFLAQIRSASIGGHPQKNSTVPVQVSMLLIDTIMPIVYSLHRCGRSITQNSGSSAGASALGSGPRGRRFKSSLPDRSVGNWFSDGFSL